MEPESRAPVCDDPARSSLPWRRIGDDRVLRESDRLVVEAAVEMPEWRARRFRQTAIFFEGERFAVRSHRLVRRGLHVYELIPWPDDGVEQPGAVIEYDAEYVRLRAKQRAMGHATDVLAMLAVPLKPLLGFLPSRAKAVLQGTIGVHAVEATRASITLETICAILCGVMALIHVSTGGVATPALVHTLWLLPLLTLDSFMRFHAVLKEEAPGFLEWLIPARWRQVETEASPKGT